MRWEVVFRYRVGEESWRYRRTVVKGEDIELALRVAKQVRKAGEKVVRIEPCLPIEMSE